MILETVFAALLPAVLDGAKNLIGRASKKDKQPLSIADQIALETADVARLEALARLDVSNPSYPWVDAVRSLQRPAVGFIVLSTWASIQFTPVDPTVYAQVSIVAQSVIFYLFGDRTYNKLMGSR